MALFSIRDIKQLHEEKGLYFFTRATMRGFRSRVMSPVFTVADGALFVTSEQFEDMDGTRAQRLYTIRRAYDDGHIETLDGFQAYKSRNGALGAAKRAAKAIRQSEGMV